MAKVIVSAKTYTFTNGTANDATPVDASFTSLFNNDNALKVGVNDLEDGNFHETSTLTLNSAHAAAPSANGVFAVERGSSTNVDFRWNETLDQWEVTRDGTNYYPVCLISSSDPAPAAGWQWYNSTSNKFWARENTTSKLLIPDYIQVRNEQTSGTNAGGVTLGAWRTIVLNTELNDSAGLCALSSNQITLTAGTYRIRAFFPGYQIGLFQTRLQNTTDASTVLSGTSSGSASGDAVTGVSVVSGEFTIAASKALEFQVQSSATNGTSGQGRAASFGTEVYAIVELWRIA